MFAREIAADPRLFAGRKRYYEMITAEKHAIGDQRPSGPETFVVSVRS